MSLSSTTSSPYTQEPEFDQAITSTIKQLWSTRKEGVFQTKDKVSLFWVKLCHPNNTKAIVISNGRIESVWKYQELFHDLFHLGYDIYSFDHRGQGLSDRLVENRDIGYVDEFEDYVSDFSQMVHFFDLSRYEKRFILAHSMGSAIATRYLQTEPTHTFDAIAVSAPMYGVNIPWYLRPIAITYAQVLTAISPRPNYISGHKAYYSKPYEDNLLSSSYTRYSWFRKLYDNKPEMQIGGPSTRWVWQSLIACKQCLQQTRQLKVPLLILQASEDVIVSNKMQNRFIKKLQKTNRAASLKIMPHSRHEILFENDTIRNEALDSVLMFFNEQ